MNKKLAACGLLLALGAGATLAQTHPKKKHGRKHAVGRRPVYKTVVGGLLDDPNVKQEYCQLSLYPSTAYEVVLFDSNKVYTYVEQMPTLNGQPAAAASIAFINKNLVIPPMAPDGRVFVKFEVNKEGSVRNAEVIKGLRADVDSAVATATRQLPHFTPGKQGGQAVAVSLVLPVTIPVRKQP